VSSKPSAARIVTTLGLFQILAWGSTYYLSAVLAKPIAADTGWPFSGIVGGFSLALLVAGPVSPFVGRKIARLGGRPVLAIGASLSAVGLAILAVSPNLAIFLAGWAVIGCGMAASLYDPAFSTLGQLYGRAARPLITYVTLFGGFASTVAWPASSFLLDHVGWRATCMVYAALEAGIAMPAFLLLLPRAGSHQMAPSAQPERIPTLAPEKHARALVLLGAILTCGSALSSFMSTHVLALLQAGGADQATAVVLGALVGPAQVGARLIEMALGRKFHPLWTMLAGTLSTTIGMTLLSVGWSVPALALIAYGMGNGMVSIVRGTVPLILFGPAGYPELMGKLGLPIWLATAAAPIVSAPLVEHAGPASAFACATFVSLTGAGLAIVLLRFCLMEKPAA
jgi:predicted MFS family arabinose efflux permease